jgi:hypothetical protein
MLYSIRLLLSLVAMIFTVFANAAEAEQSGPLIIIAADHSKSMHADLSYMSGVSDQSHIHIQTEAIVAAFGNYLDSCQTVRVDYMMWGDQPLPAVSVQLDDEAATAHFLNQLRTNLSHTNLSGTNHLQAWAKAINYAEINDAELTAIVFITDQAGSDVAIRAPDNVLVYKIAIDLPDQTTVKTYLETRMAPSQGAVIGVTVDNELAAALDQIFREVSGFLCLS